MDKNVIVIEIYFKTRNSKKNILKKKHHKNE